MRPGRAGQHRKAWLLAAWVLFPGGLCALPEGGEVQQGRVEWLQSGRQMDIRQASQFGIVDWQRFSIGQGERVNILQPDAASALLSRVRSAHPSELLGQLDANGRFYLINPNGVVVGADARIDVGEFLASTRDIADEDFLDGGSLLFEGAGSAGVVNLGTIRARNGDVILVGHSVRNTGEIHAPQGSALLGAGDRILLRGTGPDSIDVEMALPTGAQTGVDQAGLIAAARAELEAAGGHVYDLAINHSGYTRATGVERRDGRVLLVADGGHIDINDGLIAARDADGNGGQIRIGGGSRGADPELPNAASVRVGPDARFDIAAGHDAANAGSMVAWADGSTDFAGQIDGRGGAGHGAQVEISAAQGLRYTGRTDLRAPAGEAGTLVLDPPDSEICLCPVPGMNQFHFADVNDALALGNFEIDASMGGFEADSIAVNAPVTWTTANTLTLRSGLDIDLNDDISGASGMLELLVGRHGATLAPGSLRQAAGTSVLANTLAIGTNDLIQAGGAIASVGLDGIIDADTLEIRRGAPMVAYGDPISAGSDVIVADNPGNDIGTLSLTGTGNILGAVRIADGAGSLGLSGNLAGVQGEVLITTPGTLTLNAGFVASTGGNITDPDTYDLIFGSTAGNVINNAGAGSLSTADAASDLDGRILVYSGTPDLTTLGGLNLAPRYDTPFDSGSPGSAGATGDRVLYRQAPVLILSADDLGRTYGAANPVLSFSQSGLVGGDTAAEVFSGAPTLTTAATQGSDAGDYAIVIANGSVTLSDYNYALQLVNGTLSVNPAALSIRADDFTIKPGDPFPAFTATFTGLVNGDTGADVPGLVFATDAASTNDPGDYAITPSGAANPNYVIDFLEGVLTISPFDALIIRADDFLRLFGNPNPAFTASISGFVGGDDESDVSGLQFATAAVPESPIGTYAITPFGATAPANYTLNYIDGTLTIDPRLLNIAAHDTARVFGDANPAFDVTFTGLAPFHTPADIAGVTITSTATEMSGIGTYPIAVSGGINGNYIITRSGATLTVSQRPLTITADSGMMTFGDATPLLDLNFDNLAPFHTPADIIGVSLSAPFHGGFPADETRPPDAGTYPVTVTGGVNPNYLISRVDGELIINPRPVTAIASDASREYGLANPDLLFGVDNEIGTAPLDRSGIVIGTDAGIASDVGSYPILLGGIASDPNYVVSFMDGTLTVTPAPLTVDVDDASREYGLPNPAFSATLSGLRLDDTAADVLPDLMLSSTAVTGSNVGFYPITASLGTADSNYMLDVITGLLQITPAPLSFAGVGLQERIYGDPNPVGFELTVTGLRAGDSSDDVFFGDFVTAALPDSPVGSYEIRFDGTVSSNYLLPAGGITPGTLNVLPRPLTITTAPYSREYGAPDPAIQVLLDNLASFDTAAAVGGVQVTPPPAGNPVGEVPVFVDIGFNNPNYDITLLAGIATITPAPIRVLTGDISLLFGEAVPPLDGAVGPEQMRLGEDPSILGLRSELSGTVPDAGTYALAFTLSNPNYFIDASGGTLTVLPRPVNVSFGPNLVRPYGEPNDEISVFLDAPQRGDSTFDIIEVVNEGGQFAPPGDYPFRVNLINPNYELGVVDIGMLTVVPRLIALKPANHARIYGDLSDPIDILIGELGLAEGDSIEDLVSDISIRDIGGAGVDFEYFLNELLANEIADRRLGAALRLTYVQINPDSEIAGNYTIISEPGLFQVLPRPIVVTVADAVQVNEGVLPPFEIFADNLSVLDDIGAIFPSLSIDNLSGENRSLQFQLLESDLELPGQPIPAPFENERFADATFLANHPLRNTAESAAGGGELACDSDCQLALSEVNLAPAADDPAGSEDVLPGYGNILVVDTGDGLQPVSPEGCVSNDGVVSCGLDVDLDNAGPVRFHGEVVLAGEGDVTTRRHEAYIRPVLFPHPNYTVTRVINGQLIYEVNPAEVQRLVEELERDKLLRELNLAFERPPGGVGAFGLRVEEFGLMFEAVEWAAQYAVTQREALAAAGLEADAAFPGEQLADAIRRADGDPDGPISELDYALFFADIHTNFEKQALLGPAMMQYGMHIISKDADEMNAAELSFARRFAEQSEDTQAIFADHLRERQRVHEEEMESTRASMGSLGGVSTGFLDYREMVGEALSATVEESVTIAATHAGDAAAIIGGSAVAAGVAVGTTVALGAATILPYKTVAIGASLGAIAGGAAGAAVGTAAVVAAEAAVIGYAIYKFVDDKHMKNKYSELIEGGGPVGEVTGQVGGIELNFEDDRNSKVKAMLAMSTMTSMLFGEQPAFLAARDGTLVDPVSSGTRAAIQEAAERSVPNQDLEIDADFSSDVTAGSI